MNKCNSCTLATAIEIHETTLGDKNQKDSKLIFSGYKANVEWIITLRWKRWCGAKASRSYWLRNRSHTRCFTLKCNTILWSGYWILDKNMIRFRFGTRIDYHFIRIREKKSISRHLYYSTKTLGYSRNTYERDVKLR